MPYMISFQDKPAKGRSSVAEIPAEVKEEVEQAYEFLTANPDKEGYAVFDTKEEKTQYAAHVRGYCASREGGVLKFRILPSKNLPETHMRFSLTADLPENAERNAPK